MIAISYRREDSMPIAGRLYDRLQAKFGKQNVFMDFDSIPPGVDFRERIRHTIERSNLVIAVIGPHWLGEQSDGSRRIDDPTDFVRLEIDYALKGGIPVIPLLVNSTLMPKPEKLPPEIEALAFRNALPLDSGMDFHSHAERLINSIANIRTHSSGELRSRIAIWGTITIIAVALVLFLFQRRQRVNEPKRVTSAEQTNVTIEKAPETTAVPTQSPHDVVAPDANQPTPVETNRDVAPPTTTPTSVEARPSETPAALPKPKKLFAGKWEGTQNPFDRNGKALPGF